MDVYTQRQWAIAWETQIGGVASDDTATRFIEGWCIMEGGGGVGIQGSTNQCTYNCLNTEEHYGNSTNCTSGGVQSFSNVRDALIANSNRLHNGLYQHLLVALQTGDGNALGMNKGSTMSTDIVKELGCWTGYGCGSANDYATSAEWAKKILKAAGGVGDIGVGQQIQSGVNSLTDPLGAFIQSLGDVGTQLAAWIDNPVRIFKAIIGLGLIGVGVYLVVKTFTPTLVRTFT